MIGWRGALVTVALAGIVRCAGAGSTAAPPPVPRPVASTPAPATAPRLQPIADYEPLAGVVIHTEVEDLAPELRPALSKLLGPRLVLADWTAPNRDPEVEDGTGLDPTLHWLRDYQPIALRAGDGGLRLIHYLAENPNRSAFRPPAPTPGPQGHSWLPGPHGSGRWVPSGVMPLLHENGNLLVVGERVIVSELLFEDNAETSLEPHLLQHGFRSRSRGDVLRVLARALGRRVEDVIVLPPMPHEGTGHVDLFLLPLDDHTVMVPQIEDAGLAEVKGPARGLGRVVQVFLDEQAARLTELGFQVPRWPMMPPAWMDLAEENDEDEGEEGGDEMTHEEDGPDSAQILADFDLVVFSPANSLLLDVAPRDGWPRTRIAVLPSFDSVFDDPVMKARSAKYLARWGQAAKAAGWTPVVVDASDLVGYLGLFHCISWPLPMD